MFLRDRDFLRNLKLQAYLFIYSFIYFLMFIFERDRDTEWEWGRDRERGRQNPKQALGSELSAQSLMRGSNSRTRLKYHDLS